MNLQRTNALQESQFLEDSIYSGAGQVVFSPDGSKFVQYVIKSMFKIPSIGYKRQILFYTSLDFFAIAAGYVCKICLV